MLSVHRRSIVLLAFSFSLLFSSVVIAHPENSSLLQAVFGENLIHWLTVHQGFVFLSTGVILAIGWLFHRSIVKLQNINEIDMNRKH